MGYSVIMLRALGTRSEDVDSLKKGTKHYLYAIYESAVPFCFDVAQSRNDQQGLFAEESIAKGVGCI